ncbi:accessory factor UbiK family protein [Swingsia samuiensis]|uniref:Accessory factor UbiK family protein n=1 Tax=Swingsia samuiensis TaxID=1293412 RepID=A0A4Y6UJH1_9PROT|nr:accessory factor UbiK family protein [Swingsia samuiensis]QDH16960.1 accessory factor UbiK family protein [Swingsia samuiensis]
MADRPRFFDDIAGLAGNAFSAFAGAREEVHSIVRTRVDEILNSLDLVRRDEFEAVLEMAARARASQEEAESRLNSLESRLKDLEGSTGSKQHHSS